MGTEKMNKNPTSYKIIRDKGRKYLPVYTLGGGGGGGIGVGGGGGIGIGG
jgi:hypothetical protein